MMLDYKIGHYWVQHGARGRFVWGYQLLGEVTWCGAFRSREAAEHAARFALLSFASARVAIAC